MAAFGAVPQLEAALYPAAEGARGCVLRLRRGAEAGCAAAGGRASGALERWSAGRELPLGRFAVVGAGSEAAAALRALAAGPASPPAGILVLSPGAGDSVLPATWSPVGPLERRGHPWNPAGAGTSFLGARFGAPVFALGPGDSERALAWARANAQAGFKGHLWEAEAAAQMWAAGTGGSEECLRAGLCLPLGGYSPLLRLPPAGSRLGSMESLREVVIIAAQLDSAALFSGDELGAGTAAGLVAGLAAVEAVQAAGREGGGTPGSGVAEIAFAGLAGEPWGGLGSKRLLLELAGGELGGRELAGVRGIVAVGAVSGPGLLTSHNCSRDGKAEHSAGGNVVAEALAAAAAGPLQGGGSLRASLGRFGPPPGLCETLGRGADGPSVAALENFEDSISNTFYQGYLDAPPGVVLDPPSVAAAAELIALAVLRLADPEGGPARKIDFPRLNATVHSLVECLGAKEPGLRCDIARQITTLPPGPAPVAHYVGVLPPTGPSSDVLDPSDKEPLERFVWGWLAEVGAEPGSSEAACGGKKFGACTEPKEVCAGWRPDLGSSGAGRCLKSPATYVPAWPIQLVFDESSGLWTVDSTRDDPEHPLWTESYWPAGHPSLRFLLRNGREGGTFLLGLFVLLSSLAAAYAARAGHRRRLRRR